jgi:hypothetical protein
MVEVLMAILWGQYSATILKVDGRRALVSFSHPSETGLQKMWVPASEVGVINKPTPIVYDGGGVEGACVTCGCVYEEYACLPGQCLFEEEENE